MPLSRTGLQWTIIVFNTLCVTFVEDESGFQYIAPWVLEGVKVDDFGGVHGLKSYKLYNYKPVTYAIGIMCVVESVFELQKYSYGTEDFTEKIVQICIGSVLVISAFVGCCGAVNGSVKILSFFVILLLALIASHAWRLWRCNEVRVRNSTKDFVNYTWVELIVDPTKMDPLQEAYECCGIKGYTDYTVIGLKVPGSCYQVDENNKRSFYPYGQGCMTAVSEAYLNIYHIEKWTNVGLICFEFLGITLSFLLIYSLTADTRVYSY